MNGGISELVAEIRARPGETALLCDLDGTISQIVDRPTDAAVPKAATEALEALSEELGLVAVITGRPVVLARELVGAAGVHYAGNHGLETLAPGDSEPTLHPALQGHERAASKLVEEHAPRLARSGVTIEDKGPIVAMHWRTAPDRDSASQAAAQVAEAARRAGLEPRPGRMVMEIRPDVAVDKGDATAHLLSGSDRIRIACYAGDDLTDLDAFAELGRRLAAGELDAAWRVGVLSPETPGGLEEAADVCVEDTDGFLELLDSLRGRSA